MSQNEYIKGFKQTEHKNNRHSKEILSDKEVTYVRQLIRKVNWLATQTKHDLSFDVNNMMSCL